jgi:hypothetical protein
MIVALSRDIKHFGWCCWQGVTEFQDDMALSDMLFMPSLTKIGQVMYLTLMSVTE